MKDVVGVNGYEGIFSITATCCTVSQSYSTLWSINNTTAINNVRSVQYNGGFLHVMYY